MGGAPFAHLSCPVLRGFAWFGVMFVFHIALLHSSLDYRAELLEVAAT